MKHRILRALAATVGLGMAVAPVTPAVAASTYGSGATTQPIVLDLLDQLTLELANTTSALESLPVGDAAGVAVKLADQVFGATSASSTGETTQQPESGSGCLTPDLGIVGLDLGVVCSISQAGATPLPFGHGTTAIGATSVNGALLADLVDAIVELLTGSLGVALDDAVATVTSAVGPVLEPLISQLESACNTVLADNDLGDVADTLGGVIGSLGDTLPDDIATAIDPVEQAIIDAIGADNVCTVLTDLLTDLPSIDSILDILANALDEVLSSLDLLTVAVGNTVSDSTTATESIVSNASLTGLTLSTLSLADIQDVLDAVVDGIVNALLAELDLGLGELLPSASDIVAILDGVLPTGLVLSDDPILSLDVTPTAATASLDRLTGEVTSSGQAAIATIDLSDTLALLLGEENTTITVEPGMAPVTLLEGTPLETRLAVGDVATFTDEQDGMPVAGAIASSIDLVVGAGLPGGGVHLVGGAATAQVTGIDVTPAQPTEEEPSLPRTGGGLALLGLVALSGLALRRR